MYCNSITDVTCPILSVIANGNVFQNGVTVGSIATYSCDDGYDLINENERMCQPSGVWSGIEPFCKSKFILLSPPSPPPSLPFSTCTVY